MTKGDIFTDEVFTDCCLFRGLSFNTVRCEILISLFFLKLLNTHLPSVSQETA